MIRRLSQCLRPPLAVFASGFLMLAMTVPSTAEETVVIKKSATNPQVRAANNFIDQANPNTVNANALEVESRRNGNQRALVLFDLSSLPNVGIKAAAMQLAVQSFPAGNRTYGAYPIASFFTQTGVTWNTRVADLPWGTVGGDIPGTATNTARTNGRSSTLSWDITADVQNWYSGSANNVPVPNFGELIRDQTENTIVILGAAPEIIFDSNSSGTPPQLTITFVQNVANLTATAGNNQVTLNWSYPAAIGAVVNGTATNGVLIVRSVGVPVNKNTVPTDGSSPALCSALGNGTVVFNNTKLATTFTDNSSDTCGAPANGTMVYYKVFTQDSARNYSASGTSAQGGAVSVPEAAAMPSASSPDASNWILATYTTNLAPPSLFPNLFAMVGTQSDFLFSVNPITGLRSYPPISLGGAISGRSPIVDAAESSSGQDMVYVADQSGLAYGIAADTGQIVWSVDPLNNGGTPFFAAGALVVKNFAGSADTLPHDLLILGTRNSATTTGNSIVAVDANTGATVWTVTGGGGVPSMDMINNTPVISYTKNVVWVTSDSNGGTTQPSLWELDINTGKVLATLNLGDIDSSPILTPDESVLFVGNNVGTISAIDTSTAKVITSIAGGDGAVTDYPVIVGFSSPFSIFYSGTTAVHGLTYNATAKTFTANWSTTLPALTGGVVNTPSAPISVFGLSDVFVGGADGLIHELDANTGTDMKDLTVNAGQPGIIGDPSLDVSLMHIYVSTNDQRMYSFPFPF